MTEGQVPLFHAVWYNADDWSGCSLGRPSINWSKGRPPASDVIFRYVHFGYT
jgi:hypothetical protein